MIVDVRTSEEYEMGYIAGAINIPLNDLRSQLSKIPTDQIVYLYCASGLRSYLAIKILLANGYNQVYNLSGGYKTYSAATSPIDNESTAMSSKYKTIDTNQSGIKTGIKTIRVDACGLQCPGPVLKLKQTIDSMDAGQQLEMTATDAGFARDAQAWCNSTGNLLISNFTQKGKYTVLIEKGQGQTSCSMPMSNEAQGKTFIMFSDDLDKALATFVLANGAAATGKKVTIFFTFWGLNVIKKTHKPKIKKDIFGKMFGLMLPSSSLKLKLSKMHMWGMGSRVMRKIMKGKGIDSLESLREQAILQGVEFIACQMSMDVMGVKKEELLDNVTIGGVATYMERADQANMNLFI